MGPTVRDVVTRLNSQSFLPPYALKLFLTTTSLFEQINLSSADCITLPGKFPLKQGLFHDSVDTSSRVSRAFKTFAARGQKA